MVTRKVDGVHVDPTAKPHVPGKSTNPFTALYQKAVASGQVGKKTEEAINWFKNAARSYKNPIALNSIQQSLGNSSRRTVMTIGKMYAFLYDAKTKDDLKYWDSVPLIFPFAEDATHFWGINLHYVSPRYRGFIMNQLYKLISDNNMNERTKLRITYNRLNRMATFRFFAPAIKCYLKSHFRSQFIHIPVDHWHTAMFLPVAKWNKASAAVVYNDYNQLIKKARTPRTTRTR